jgi:hypothetical protein
MYQKDYILRMIEMLGELLRAIFGKINKRQYEQAEEAINEAYLLMLRKDSAFFQSIPEGSLTQTLIEDHNYSHHHLEVLAGLLYAEASLNQARTRKEESLPFYRKSLRLFEFVEETNKTYSQERHDIMNDIRKRIGAL